MSSGLAISARAARMKLAISAYRGILDESVGSNTFVEAMISEVPFLFL
jgi:hypothetical protein